MRLRHHLPSAVLVAAVGTAVTACTSTAAPAPAHSAYVELTGGSYQGQSWHLLAWTQQSRLCMAVLPRDAEPGGDRSAGPGWAAGAGAGCGFDQDQPSSGWFASGTGPDGSSFSFGPLPTAATQIRVASKEILTTGQLPAGQGLPAGRYWIHLMAKGWPTSADGGALDTPQPLDASGHPVSFQRF